jgi:hypothetical protein
MTPEAGRARCTPEAHSIAAQPGGRGNQHLQLAVLQHTAELLPRPTATAFPLR